MIIRKKKKKSKTKKFTEIVDRERESETRTTFRLIGCRALYSNISREPAARHHEF